MKLPHWMEARLGRVSPDGRSVTVHVWFDGKRLADMTTPAGGKRR